MVASTTNFRRLVNNLPTDFDPVADCWGLLFLNMGGPEALEDIEPYLYNIFSDASIIRLPLSFILQKSLARLIASRRTPGVREHYRLIGGGSPLLKWSRKVADDIEKNLRQYYPNMISLVGMRYSPPFIGEAMDKANAAGCRHLMVVPFYPHYSLVTTGTALMEINRWLSSNSAKLSASVISDWHDCPGYIELLKVKISEAMNKVENPDMARLVFSAHSLPLKIVKSGDPYVDQVRRTVSLAGEGYDYILGFQSRSGPVKWQGPETVEIVDKLGREGVREIVIVPISFVSDHIETLYEIDIEMKELALRAGIKSLIRTESFNDDPRFISFLSEMISRRLESI
nr:ferrochelatase [candidate division Zixibacteria bacterium]